MGSAGLAAARGEALRQASISAAAMAQGLNATADLVPGVIERAGHFVSEVIAASASAVSRSAAQMGADQTP